VRIKSQYQQGCKPGEEKDSEGEAGAHGGDYKTVGC
jgi:hypothetical protein